MKKAVLSIAIFVAITTNNQFLILEKSNKEIVIFNKNYIESIEIYKNNTCLVSVINKETYFFWESDKKVCLFIKNWLK